MKEFFTIGEISKLFNINKKTLRYYDEIDLFKPSYVDEHNKYRYYSIDQFECLETIQYLKELGLTLNKIKYHLNTLNLSSIVDSLEYQKLGGYGFVGGTGGYGCGGDISATDGR